MNIGQLPLAMNIGTILLVAAIILGLVWYNTPSGKRDKKKTLGWVALVAVGLGLMPVFGFGGTTFTDPLGTGTTTSVTTTPGQTVPGTTICAVEDTTVTISAKDAFTAAAAGTTHRYTINGAPALTISNAQTFTASPGDIVKVLFGNETDGTYFGDVKTVTISCLGTETITTDLYQNGTVTIQVFNEEGNLIDGSGENETLGAGDVANLKIEIRGTNQRGFPHGGYLTLEVNGTDFDEENIELDLAGLNPRKVSSPTIHTLGNVANKLVTWEIDAFSGAALHSGTLTLDVATTPNPGDTNDPAITFRPKDYFIDEDTGGSYGGPAVEDEDNVATFGHSTASTINVD